MIVRSGLVLNRGWQKLESAGTLANNLRSLRGKVNYPNGVQPSRAGTFSSAKTDRLTSPPVFPTDLWKIRGKSGAQMRESAKQGRLQQVAPALIQPPVISHCG
jgi:hypothetical protein